MRTRQFALRITFEACDDVGRLLLRAQWRDTFEPGVRLRLNLGIFSHPTRTGRGWIIHNLLSIYTHTSVMSVCAPGCNSAVQFLSLRPRSQGYKKAPECSGALKTNRIDYLRRRNWSSDAAPKPANAMLLGSGTILRFKRNPGTVDPPPVPKAGLTGAAAGSLNIAFRPIADWPR